MQKGYLFLNISKRLIVMVAVYLRVFAFSQQLLFQQKGEQTSKEAHI
ncbi:hypothetical protein [Metabacillus litoralis]|jgi:hypothetical protein|nr:hypothetical protein [Metabacillus litoralis]